MSTSTLARRNNRTATRRPNRRAEIWTCENCRTETTAVRKRCADCGTSRY